MIYNFQPRHVVLDIMMLSNYKSLMSWRCKASMKLTIVDVTKIEVLSFTTSGPLLPYSKQKKATGNPNLSCKKIFINIFIFLIKFKVVFINSLLLQIQNYFGYFFQLEDYTIKMVDENLNIHLWPFLTICKYRFIYFIIHNLKMYISRWDKGKL